MTAIDKIFAPRIKEIALLALIAYLVFNTGLVSDDFGIINYLKGKTLMDTVFIDNAEFVTLPAEHIILLIWYRFFGICGQTVLNIFKIFFMGLTFLMVSRFFRIYLPVPAALTAAFLFIFFPSHDSTAYWFLAYYLTLSMAFYLYAFYLLYNDRMLPALVFAFLGSFISYGSPIIGLALGILFFMHGRFKKGVLIAAPAALFSAYYFLATRHVAELTNKIPAAFDAVIFFKQFTIQILSGIDSLVGPSMWFKMYYAFSGLKLPSIVIGIAASVGFYAFFRSERVKFDARLLSGLTALALISFAVFAVTGLYPQMAFNLGNRVTIFSSLLMAYCLTVLPLSHRAKSLIAAVFIFAILGISDHWKAWSLHQQKVMTAIKNNKDLDLYNDQRHIYVSGNQYSKYGPLSHIEFFSEAGVIGPVSDLLLGRRTLLVPINKRFVYRDGYMVDLKYDERKPVKDYIYVYDSERDMLIKVVKDDINKFIANLPDDNRHWIQFLDQGPLKTLLVKIMPRLSYAFQR